jgi:hypothetical protein
MSSIWVVKLRLWMRRRANLDAFTWRNSGVFKSGRYAVPAIEDTAGQTSATKVILDRDRRAMTRLVNETFDSIRPADDVKSAAAVKLMEQRIQDVRLNDSEVA